MNTFRAQVFLVLPLFLLGFLSQIHAGQDAKQVYERAIQLEAQLNKSDSLQQSPSNWKKVIDAFRKVYYQYPSSGYCDNALFHVATLYSRMGERFHDSLYFRRANSTFQFLIEQYSASSLVEESMMEYIRITRDELKNADDAARMHAQLRRKNPKAAAAIEKRPSATPVQPASLKSLRHYTGEDYSRIVLDFDREISFKRNRLANPDRLYFDFENTVAMKSLVEQQFSVDDGFLKQIRVGQNTYRTARVVLDLKSIERYEVFPLYHPYRIVIDIQGKKGIPPPPIVTTVPDQQPAPSKMAPEMAPEMAKSNTNGKYSLARQLGLKVRKIIVDPGHGGHDPGAIAGNVREKDITLDVAKRLRKLLETEYGYEVFMTREDDRYVPLEERTALANSNAADLFVSVHVNSSRNRHARGIETYYLNFATTPEAMEVAARENAIAEKNMAELQKLTSAIALNSKIDESREFAQSVQATLVGHLKKGYSVNSLGVKQAPFYVLIGAQMPSVLAEISFLSNKQESALLTTDRYRQSLAEGLARGVSHYVATLAESKLTQNRK